MSSPDFNIFRTVAEMRSYVKRRRVNRSDHTFGLVPTMGALHEGHLALTRSAAKENGEVIVSIYVNPTQFGVNEDLSSYPRTFDSDLAKLHGLRQELRQSPERHGDITTVFAPTSKEMYPTLPPTSEPDGHGSFVSVTPMAHHLEGASRPVFFRGVATVCMKLFNIVAADRAYFGQKDGQQAALIKRMVRDFHVDTEIKVLPTIREPDGLALSSRNVYLGTRRRNAALLLPRMLQRAAKKYTDEDVHDVESIIDGTPIPKQLLDVSNPRVQYWFDYISLNDLDTMENISQVDKTKGAMLSAAMIIKPVDDPQPGEDLGESEGRFRNVRLIDNFILPPKS